MNDEQSQGSPPVSQNDDSSWWHIGAGVLIALAVLAGFFLIRDWSDPCRGQITDLLGCLVAGYEADADAPAAPPAAPSTADPLRILTDDPTELRRAIADLAEFLELQSDAEYCAEFPEDRACNGTDP